MIDGTRAQSFHRRLTPRSGKLRGAGEMTRPPLPSAAHLVHGDSAAMTLRGLGAMRVLVRRDLLTVGPCDVDPTRHRALRQAHWGGPPDTASGFPSVDADADLASALAVERDPIV